ncbi:bifunctional adenosylcobinamide kinase/adenosylcobinamide-phosphate guanylyltransferase [Deinococcus sp.]|uniref:bifunctional adenosylcobinamide kinase/adenosylcobinamide-phosphate guanylyltransferase n=1 Tax=Deinococcus sp. TaxID=47478 RepID=UPI003CC64888
MLIYVTGGARSGKSRFAEERARQLGGDAVTYLATAQPLDAEMQARIERHRADRPPRWITVEEPLELERAVQAAPTPVVLLDCLSLWVSNLLLRGDSEAQMLKAAGDLLATQRRRGGTLIAVSNEVGLGIVPDNALARQYRDALGRVNQAAAAAADEAYLLVSGLEVKLK